MHDWAAPLWFTLLLMKSAPAKIRCQVAAYLVPLLLVAVLVSGDQLAKSTTVYAAPDAGAAPAVLKIEGAVPTPLSLTPEDLDKMPRATAQLSADGTTTTYEGVLLYDLLVKAGWQFGHGMTGKPMASYLIATGKDGYEVVFALPEIDPQFSGAKVIIADKADGAALPSREQPFRIVAPEDKMHA